MPVDSVDNKSRFLLVLLLSNFYSALFLGYKQVISFYMIE